MLKKRKIEESPSGKKQARGELALHGFRVDLRQRHASRRHLGLLVPQSPRNADAALPDVLNKTGPLLLGEFAAAQLQR